MTQQEREVSRRDQGGYSTGRTEIAQKIVSTRKIVEAKLTRVARWVEQKVN